MVRAFANLEGLMRLSQREGVDIRPSLLRVLTDLYVQNETHSREEELQYVELAMRLLPNVDVATRTAVAAKFASYAAAPAVLVEQLRGEITSARAELTKNPSHRPLVARLGAPPRLDAGLVESTLPASKTRLQNPPLGDALFRGNSKERRELLRSLVDDDSTPEPSSESPPGCIERLERAALELRSRDFAAEMQLALGLSQRIATQIVQDDDGEPVLVACKALGMHVDVLLRILLFLNPTVGQSVERVFSLYRFYEEITPSAAHRIVGSWREGVARHGAHQPVHASDGEQRDTSLTSNTRSGVDRAAVSSTSVATPIRRHGTI
jgi:hypothetical protein